LEAILQRPVILVHGGAWYIPDSEREAYVAGCRRAALAGWTILNTGGSALDAVEAAVNILEDDPTYDAGRGSYVNRDGRVQMDAIIMDGGTLDFGAVAAVERIRNPISVARLVLTHSQHRLIVGQGAEAFAESRGYALCEPDGLLGKRDTGGWSPPVICSSSVPEAAATHPQRLGDTVGAVALDLAGHLAVATSTGGTPDKWPGRVGDSPLVGCGAYADDQVGAAAATGSGESLMRIVVSKAAVDLMADGYPAQEAADRVVARLWGRVRGYGGVILVDRQGRIGLAHNTPNLSFAFVTPTEDLTAGVERSPLATPGRAEGLVGLD
jgi:beta-aspartyl-peptidase (threonine type)